MKRFIISFSDVPSSKRVQWARSLDQYIVYLSNFCAWSIIHHCTVHLYDGATEESASIEAISAAVNRDTGISRLFQIIQRHGSRTQAMHIEKSLLSMRHAWDDSNSSYFQLSWNAPYPYNNFHDLVEKSMWGLWDFRLFRRSQRRQSSCYMVIYIC